MADVRHRTTAGNRLRFLLRIAGLFGLMAALCGLVYLYFLNSQPLESVRDFVTGFNGNPLTGGNVVPLIVVAGAAIAALWIIVELGMALLMLSGQRASANGNVYLQIALAMGLLGVVNAASFLSYKRYDCTRDGRFTLNADLVKELKTLRDDAPTDVVVLQLHKSSIAGDAKRDDVDKAAEQKVVEKVNDLVDELRELGPRFNVTVLDIEDRYYADQVDKLPKEVREAIATAPEDSIFFHANKRVRRMSFSDFYRLDKTSSLKEETVVQPDGTEVKRTRSTNLVLIPQGRENFVRKVLGVEERKPKIGLVTIHKILSTREQSDELSSPGLRKTLEANGFEVTDIIIKKWGGREPSPAAMTYEEFELDRLESRFNLYTVLVQDREMAVKQLTEAGKLAATLPLTEVDRRFRRAIGKAITTESDRAFVTETLSKNIELLSTQLAEFQKELSDVEPKLKALQLNEKANDARRITDVPAKLKAAVNDCDLLIVPRVTTVDLANRHAYPPDIFNMSSEQAEVLKDFMKAGKPVLACFGPIKMGARMDAQADDVEKLFTRFGIEFGNQAVFTDDEARSAADRQGESLASATELPRLVFDFKADDKKTANPITAAYLTAGRSVGGKLEIRKSGPRPIYLNPAVAAKLPFAAVILESVKESWNEEKPVPEDDYIPKFEAAKFDDARKGTKDEERRGPFPIGVAIEAPIPAEWVDDTLAAAQAASSIGGAAGGLGLSASTLALDAADFAKPGAMKNRPVVRIVAFGHGGLFTGKDLGPGQEQLLLSTLNWQLHRDDRLPQDAAEEAKWRFPRVQLTSETAALWLTATRFLLPALCVFTGIAVLMLRRFR
ncbi:hypothetical protein BH11PLA2_BH11PLA2_06370 [soil metagenome]